MKHGAVIIINLRNANLLLPIPLDKYDATHRYLADTIYPMPPLGNRRRHRLARTAGHTSPAK